jgi:hypothetical protein
MNEMNKREYMTAALKHQETDVIPFIDGFSGPDARDYFMGKEWQKLEGKEKWRQN